MPEGQRRRPIEGRLREPLEDYYLERLTIHAEDSYLGVPLFKLPEDLRTYEHLLDESRANVVVEIGSGTGASALWFRDRLLTLERYGRVSDIRVVSVDIEADEARRQVAGVDPAFADTIVFVEGDVCDPKVAAEVRRHLPARARPMVVEDSAHRFETTMAALRHFSDLVPLGGFFVVEDGHVDIEGMRHPVCPPGIGGVLAAVDQWLRSDQGQAFAVERHQERYVVTGHPRGFLRRVAPATTVCR